MGALDGVRVVELAGLGPGPFAGMMLADMGAEVLSVGRPGQAHGGMGALDRGKRAVSVDLKAPGGAEAVLALTDAADVVIDVFRPGVAERLGIGPDVACSRNPRLVYVRLTGYGQTGPWADEVGHDITYLALSGALEPLGRADGPPTPPINVLGDFAGGGMLAVVGTLAALVERGVSGQGQVVDAAMVDGASLLMAPFFAGRANGGWGPRGTNLLDGAAPFYDVHLCADGRWLAIGALEPHFYAALMEGLGLDDVDPTTQHDPATWPELRVRIAEVVATRERDEWVEVFTDLDACVAPVLDPLEAVAHPHAVSRDAFRHDARGLPEPNPAPRLSRTQSVAASPALDTPARDAPADVEAATVEVLVTAGLDPALARSLAAAGAVTLAPTAPA